MTARADIRATARKLGVEHLLDRPREVRPHADAGLVARLAPGTIRKLEIELTPARAAALDVFELTTGADIKTHILDFIDDLIFEVRGGGKP